MNIIKHSDSYKFSHFKQYPPGTQYVSSYIEARKANPKEIRTDKVVFFGLQAYLKKYFLNGTFTPADIELAARVAKLHGEPFNEEGWRYIFAEYDGRLPIEIEAVPEGSVVDVGTPLLQMRNTDPKVPWLTNYLETSLLRAIWYPTTIATLSYSIKNMMRKYWNESVDDANLGGLFFALHDFGARGAASAESAGLGGMAHLLSFNGTDTVEALYAADQYYPEHVITGKSADRWKSFDTDYIAGYSVPAAEHSTITSWGKGNEEDSAIANMVDQFGGEGKIYSVVADSYDVYDFVNRVSTGDLLDRIIARGGRFVIRPDSGDPVHVIIKVLEILEKNLGLSVTRNDKGFKVLPPYFRILQGDGVNYWSIEDILVNLLHRGWSAENLVFGMGGALLQKVNRDTLSFAMKCNAISTDGLSWTPISKNPVTDEGKKSKAGRIISGLELVYQDGLTCRSHSFSEIKKRLTNS